MMKFDEERRLAKVCVDADMLRPSLITVYFTIVSKVKIEADFVKGHMMY